MTRSPDLVTLAERLARRDDEKDFVFFVLKFRLDIGMKREVSSRKVQFLAWCGVLHEHNLWPVCLSFNFVNTVMLLSQP